MRKNRIFYVLMLMTLAFTACSKDKDTQYYQVLGTLSKTNDSTVVVADDNKRLLVNNSSSLSALKNNDRLIAYFTMADVSKPEGIDYVIDIYDYSKVLFKPVIALTDANIDSVGNDDVRVTELWLTKDYLNVNFEYYGNPSVRHYINLVSLPQSQVSDTLQLEIRHNAYNDVQSYLLRGFVTFNLSSLKDESADSLILHVKAKNGDYVYNKYVTYKY